jgi:hypothetical protein
VFDVAQTLGEWSRANIILLLKCPKPRTPKDYIPLSIENVLYRLFAKIIANRLQPYISGIVSPE